MLEMITSWANHFHQIQGGAFIPEITFSLKIAQFKMSLISIRKKGPRKCGCAPWLDSRDSRKQQNVGLQITK